MGMFMGVLMMRFKLREGSPLSVGNYIQDWEGHKSDFHNVTQYGSKMCHATVTGVTIWGNGQPSSVSVCRQGYPSTPIPPLGLSPHRPLGMTSRSLAQKEEFPYPWAMG